jgi:hypothetical protein
VSGLTSSRTADIAFSNIDSHFNGCLPSAFR